jgi:hypothetical protein
MLVPEAAIYENHGLVARKNDVWRAGQSLAM